MPVLSGGGEKGNRQLVTNCCKTPVQCVNVTAPVVLTPTTTVGEVTTACDGVPTVTCFTNAEGTACTVTTTQRVCVTIPVTYGVEYTGGEPSIACAENSCGENICPCG